MDKGVNDSIDNLMANWHGLFPQYILKPNELKNPHVLMEALFQVLDGLGIDRDFVLAPPPDECCNESTPYYWDLLPVINMMRVLKHILPEVDGHINIMHFLQPIPLFSKSIITVLLNLIHFYSERMNEIEPQEEAIFAKTEHVKTLESRKNKLLEMLNKQAEEKGKRAERLEKLGQDVKQIEEELEQEKQVHNEEIQVLEPILKEIHQVEPLLEQKKTQRDALMAEVARRKALRVYDADDIKAQAEQASQNVQEAEEKLNNLRSTLMQKESSLKNLQTIKPSLDTANNLLHEIMKLTDSLKDYEIGDLDTDSKEGELDVLNTELFELQVQLSELQATRAEAAEKQQESQAKRQNEKSQMLSALREAEEKDKKCRSHCKKASQRMEEIKELTLKYDKEKSAGMEELAAIENNFCADIKSVEDLLIKRTMDVERRVQEKILRRNLGLPGGKRECSIHRQDKHQQEWIQGLRPLPDQ